VIDAEGIIRHIFNNMLDGPAHVREAERIVKELSQG
jgi:peroxiredoxin Q/BCP